MCFHVFFCWGALRRNHSMAGMASKTPPDIFRSIRLITAISMPHIALTSITSVHLHVHIEISRMKYLSL